MHDELNRKEFHEAIDATLSGLQENPWLAQRVLNHERIREPVMRKKLQIVFILVIVLILITVTALAVVLLSPREFVESIAVPMAQQNDSTDLRQEYYTHDELVQLLHVLSENGNTIDQNTTIIQALQKGYGYWEDETLLEICRSSFGENENAWSVEQKYWIQCIMNSIGLSGQNCYLQPNESDLTESEAMQYASDLLKDTYNENMPSKSNQDWLIYPYFFAPSESVGGTNSAMWEFRYLNRKTGLIEYIVQFQRNGELIGIENVCFYKTIDDIDSFSSAERLIDSKYGSKINMSMENWVEFGQMIACLTPESSSEWCYQHAGYRMPPEGAIQVEEAIQNVLNILRETGQYREQVLCCQDEDIPIFKVNLRFFTADEADFDSIWCAEVDCMTGTIRRVEPYNRSKSPMLMQFVPFSVLESIPEFIPNSEKTERELANNIRLKAYEKYENEYQTMWYFWPLEAQKEAIGSHHDTPQNGEMTRDLASETAINAIKERYGQKALDRLGDWQTGVICCRYPEEEGVRVVWEIYITSDPVTISNGYRVTFDDPGGHIINPIIEIQSAKLNNN